MDFNQMLPTLQSQASRIFNGDKDPMQDALGMAYLNYTSCINRKSRELSIGELTNFIKHRATELNNGTRPHSQHQYFYAIRLLIEKVIC